MNKSIVIAGSLAQRPGHGGHAWVFLQYLLGFRQLGWDVLFLDRLLPEMCLAKDGTATSLDESWNLEYFQHVMRGQDLENCYSLDYNHGERTIGIPRSYVLETLRHSACLINVMGFLLDEQLLSAARRRVFLDIDPGFGQMWRDLGWADLFKGHSDFVTIGLNVGARDCQVPTCGLKWITTRQPIVLERWPVSALTPDGAFTTIASWRGPFAPVEYRGHTYGLRVHEFRKFFQLPACTGQQFELAMDIHPNEMRDLQALRDHGWSMTDPRIVACAPEDYQRYIGRSKAEFMVAKGLYVETRGGWFSDRSICYLANGKPVLAQDTGLSDHLPSGHGLLLYSTLDEAVNQVDAIRADYAHHCHAAREVAEEQFSAEKVLSKLIAELGI